MTFRRHRPPASGPIPTGGRTVILVQLLLAVTFAAFLLIRQDVFVDDGYELAVAFPDAGGLAAEDDAPVTVAGVPSGRVVGVRVRDGRAVATLRLDGDTAGRVHQGATARIQPRSALNDLTVELTAGDPARPALRDGDDVTPDRAAAPVTLDEILDTLDADTRAAVQLVVAELDMGLRGRNHLERALQALEPATASAAEVADALADRRVLVRRLVQSVDTLFTELGRRGEDLRGAIEAANDTLAVTARRRGELDASIRAMPATLAGVRTALAATRRLAQPLNPALDDLRPAARRLPGALDALREQAPEARRLVAAVDGLARESGDDIAALRGALTALGPAAAKLEQPVRRLDPITKEIDARKEGIGLLGERFSGVFSTNDANGTILRGLGFFEPFDPRNFGFGADQRARAARDVVRLLTRTCLQDNEAACLVRYLVPGLPGAVRKK